MRCASRPLFAIAATLALTLAACGEDARRGGGRGGTPNPPPNPPPPPAGTQDGGAGDANQPASADGSVINPQADASTPGGIDATTHDSGPPMGACTAGRAECTDSFAYHVCGAESPGAPTSFGPRVACFEGNTCSNGQCLGSCVSPEVVLIVDRSSSMLGARWDMVRAAIQDFVDANQADVRFGLRMFPSGGGCNVGSVLTPQPNAGFAVTESLEPPSTDSQTPISAALDDILSAYGDPNEAQYAILITDGDETCGGAPPEQRAEALARAGVDTFVIGVSTMANEALLHRIAAAGRTGSARVVGDRAGLDSALASFRSSWNVCSSAPSSIGDPCTGDTDCGAGGMCVTTSPPPIPFPWPDGYCSQMCSEPTVPCPGTDSACISLPTGGGSFCAKTCATNTDCRSGYMCRALGAESICVPF